MARRPSRARRDRPKLGGRKGTPSMNRRVLVVDDSASLLEGVRAILAPRYEVSLAGSAAEALALCERRGAFAVVISDYAMPGMNGVDFLAEHAGQWPDSARILMTGCTDLG